jgi:N-acetylneuraminate synthase
VTRTLIAAELGVNHNGRRDPLLALVRAAVESGADAVKIQARTPELHGRADVMRTSCTTADPDELITELEHRRRLELTDGDLAALDAECNRLGIPWFASVWDEQSIARIAPYRPRWWKLASASSTDLALVAAVRAAADRDGATVIASTGATSESEADALMRILGTRNTVLCHCVMGYPVENEMLNVLTMLTLGQRYGVAVGYSGHERGVQVSAATVAMGAAARHLVPSLPWGPAVIERHLTLDRSMRGSDHAASLEPGGFAQLVRDVRVIESAMGDGVKRVLDSEVAQRARLRRVG